MRHLRLRPVVTAADLPTATMGAWDGCISVLAFLIADRAASAGLLAVAGLGGALGGCFSMGSGQYESDTAATPRRIQRAVIMAVATMAGGLLPVAGFLAGSRTVGFAVAIGATVALAAGVCWLKREGLVGAVRTYALLAATVAATLAVSTL